MRLLPSLRQKKRYVVFEIISAYDGSAKKFSFPEIKSAVESALLLFLGELGIARAAPMVIEEKFNMEKQRFMVKVNNSFVDEVKAALTLSKSIKNTQVIIKSVRVSGTIKKAGASVN